MLQFIFQYAIIVLLILLSQIVVVILWFTMQNQVWTQISIIHQMSIFGLLTGRLVITHTYIFQLDSVVRDELSTSLKNNFREDSLNGTNQLSNGWNYIFLTVRLGFRVSLSCIQQIQKENNIFISSINH